MEATHLTEQATDNRTLAYTTRFGEVNLREDRLIGFPEGILGFGDCTVFGLSRLPESEDSALMLLQCVNDPQVSFLVADPSILGLEIAREDLAQAIEESGYPAADTQFLVILTVYEQEGTPYLTANLKAPLMIDSLSRTGRQHILTSSQYGTQTKVGTAETA